MWPLAASGRASQLSFSVAVLATERGRCAYEGMQAVYLNRRMAALIALCVTTWTAIPRLAAAQETLTTASVAGHVVDPQGAVVPGAEVTARQTETNTFAKAAADGEGRFRFATLPVGPYEIVVTHPGFQDAVRRLVATAASAYDVLITLSIASMTSTVDVPGRVSTLDTARSQVASTVQQTDIAQLPLNGRQFLDVALFVPGVSPTNVASTQLFAETSAVPGGGLSVGSQRNFSNNFIVDGLSANDDASGLSGMPYAVESVEQLQVVTSGGQAELGRALGGHVNVVTKSGTNTTRGALYGYFRDDALNAQNPLLGKVLPMSQEQFGGSLGGPIVRDRAFFFANVERRVLSQSGLTTIAPASVAAINGRLTATAYPGALVSTGIYDNPVVTSNVFAKVDHQVSASDGLSARVSQYTARSSNSRGAGALSAPSASAGLDNVDRSVSIAQTTTLTEHASNEARAQYADGDLRALPTDPIGPAVSIAGVAVFGTLSGSPTARTNRMFQVSDNFAYHRGPHALRVGGDVLFNADRITFPRANRGSYSFASLNAFLAGTYNNAGFTQTFGATDVAQHNLNVGLFAQDEWRAGERLTINAGLRYDLQFLDTIHTDTDNLAPRLGVAWAPSAGHRVVVRANAGLYFDRVPLRALANAILSAGNTTTLSELRQVNVNLSPAQAGAPAFPGLLPSVVPTSTLVNFTTMDRHMQNAYSRKAGIEIEHELGGSGTVSAGYQYVRGENLIISVNQNVPTCVAVGSNNGCRPDPRFANNSQYTPSASSSYHGLHLSASHRPTAWAYLRMTYTLSKAMANVGEFFFSSPIDPTDLSKDWGRSDDDQRHRVVMTGALTTSTAPARSVWERLSHGLSASGVLQYYSSLPLNVTSGVTTVQGTAGRPLVNGRFVPRNVGDGPDFLSVNLRISRSFRLARRGSVEAILEAFNVTNRRNVVTMNGNFGAGAYPVNPSAAFGQATAVGEPRTVQLAARVQF